jgi:hypothetical protein
MAHSGRGVVLGELGTVSLMAHIKVGRASGRVMDMRHVPGRIQTSLLVEAIWRDSKPRRASPTCAPRSRWGSRTGSRGGLRWRSRRSLPRCPRTFAEVPADVQVAAHWYTRVLRDTTSRLQRAMIPAVLIEDLVRGDSMCGHINLVVPRPYWQRAQGVLADCETFCLRRPDMVLIQPPAAPSLRLHLDLSWLGGQNSCPPIGCSLMRGESRKGS